MRINKKLLVLTLIGLVAFAYGQDTGDMDTNQSTNDQNGGDQSGGDSD